MGIDLIAGAAVDLLFLMRALTFITLLVVVAHRRYITITDICNASGQTSLDLRMKQLSEDFRLAAGAQLENTRRALQRYYKKVHGSVSDRCYVLILPDMKDALINRPDDTLLSLAASLEAGASRDVASQMKALGAVIARPRGATVNATLYTPADGRLGISVEVVSPASRFARRHLLSETQAPDPRTSLPARVERLLQPAARYAAIELAVWVLLRRKRLAWRRGGRRREGLAHNMAGLLMNASAREFPGFARQLRESAREELKAAAILLTGEHQPHYNLAMVNEADGLAAADRDTRYRYFVSALDEYSEAEQDCQDLAEPARNGLIRRIQVSRTRTELVSGFAQYRDKAFDWLGSQPLDLALDCHPEERERGWPPRIPLRGPAKLALDQLSAECLYNSACTYAMAADASAKQNDQAHRDDWDLHARRLLGAALALDTGDRYLWARAGNDPDLQRLWRLSSHFPEFKDRLRESAPADGRIGWKSIDDVKQQVDRIRTEVVWRTPPSRQPGVRRRVLRLARLVTGGRLAAERSRPRAAA